MTGPAAPAAVLMSGVDMVFNPGGGQEVRALEGIDLEVGRGEFISLIGPSGCGKSTLLRLAGDLLSPTAGRVAVNGKDPSAARLDREYGMVFQSATLLEWRKVRANVFYKPVVEPLGGSIVTLSGAEIYSALQKGVVEGAAWPVLGAVNFKWYEVTKYMTRPRFGSSPYIVFMNTDRFKKLSQADRELLLKIGRDLERETPKVFDDATEKEIAALKSFGVQETYLHPEAAKTITVGHQKGIWKLALSQKTSKERTMKLYEKAFANGHAPKL